MLMALSGILEFSHVSVNIRAQQSLSLRWVVKSSLKWSILFSSEQTFDHLHCFLQQLVMAGKTAAVQASEFCRCRILSSQSVSGSKASKLQGKLLDEVDAESLSRVLQL